MKEITVKLYDIEEDGLPPEEGITGRLAFIFDGCIVSGWPLYNIHIKYPGNDFPMHGKDVWEANSDVGHQGKFVGIKKYVIFEKPMWDYEQNK